MPSHFTSESSREYVSTERIGSKFLAFTIALTVFAYALPGQYARTSAPVTRSAVERTERDVHGSPGRFGVVLVHRRLESASPAANRLFNEGLSLYFAYRRATSVEAFREAQRVDPRCVMCALGEAIALGPTVDASMTPAAATQALAAIRRAQALVRSGVGSISEAEWVRAVASRYTGGRVATPRVVLDSAYATAMAALADGSPQDADAQVLAAEAAMLLSPHHYWSADGRARAGTGPILGRLQQAMRSAPGHAGACFLSVHVLEAVEPGGSCAPERLGRH
jgi:hypothetical protein